MKLALTYDDIQLCPAFSAIEHRADISLRTRLSTNYELLIPLVASPMDTICEFDMALKMMQLGGVGCIHRFMTIEEQANQIHQLFTRTWTVKDVWVTPVPIMAAVGANGDYLERAKSLVEAGANVILIDVAHGHHINVQRAIGNIKELGVDVIAGNIATAEAALDLQKWGADGLRCGIGGGSLCISRIQTGFGVPNVTCLIDICSVATVPVMIDGGIRVSGDIAKALALNADSIMVGSLLAGTEETPGKIIETPNGLYKRYRGSASLETKTVHGMSERNVEGVSTIVPFKGGTKFVIEGLIDGIRSALSYAGANNLSEFHPEWVQVTNAGIVEAKPHLVG